MARFIKKISKSKGLTPGSVVYIGVQRTEDISIDLIDYTEADIHEETIQSPKDIGKLKDTPSISWINVNGIHDVEKIELFGDHFGIHDLTLEDIANTGHRPKIEALDDYIFVVLKMLYKNQDEDDLVSEQISIIFSKTCVLSFQEKEGDVFNHVRDRIRRTVPRVKLMRSEYLAYSLIDAIVDNYYAILEQIGEKIESLEDILINNPSNENLESIHDLKRELIFMRKSVWPLREVVAGLGRLETDLIDSSLDVYLRDLYEHTIQVIDTVETYRDMVSSLMDIYLSSVSNKMNEVMKVLTIIATIFIPLSFLAGIYGMNFDTSASPFNLPELGMRYGYPLFWIIVLIVGIGMFLFFRRKKWL